MKIYVDADACPVKKEVISIAQKEQIPVILVQSFAHFTHNDQPTGVKTIYVDSGVDAADFRIIKLAQKDDIIITQDYGLASLALPKGCKVLHHKGFMYTEQNIEQLLQSRYVSAMARKAGQRTKGPKAFTSEDKEKFKNSLQKVIDQTKKDTKQCP